jgi:hypothetical protein
LTFAFIAESLAQQGFKEQFAQIIIRILSVLSALSLLVMIITAMYISIIWLVNVFSPEEWEK